MEGHRHSQPNAIAVVALVGPWSAAWSAAGGSICLGAGLAVKFLYSVLFSNIILFFRYRQFFYSPLDCFSIFAQLGLPATPAPAVCWFAGGSLA